MYYLKTIRLKGGLGLTTTYHILEITVKLFKSPNLIGVELPHLAIELSCLIDRNTGKVKFYPSFTYLPPFYKIIKKIQDGPIPW